MHSRVFAAFLFAAFLSGCQTTPSAPADLIVIAPRMLDVKSGAYVMNRAIIIRDGRIVAIEDGANVATMPAKERITLPAGSTLLPGLIDAHVHLAWDGAPNEDAARLTLLAGFTTVRNPGASGNADVVLRKSIEEGRIIGPRMLIARTGIGSPGGVCEATFGEAGVATVDEARARVRKLIGEGADFIKICTGGGVIGRPADAATVEMSQEVIDAIVDETHRTGRRVAAHAQGNAAIRAAVNAGVDSIEHGGLIDDESARLMAEKHVPLVPTLARLTTAIEAQQQNKAAADVLERLTKRRDEAIARVRRARELGIPIVFGTDGGVLPYGLNAREFESLRDIGLTPLEAIRAATVDAARLIGWETRVGTIASGFEADLMAVTNDVLTAPAPLDVKLVIARGQVVRNDFAKAP